MARKREELTPEAAVRSYLTYLSDPDSLRDEAEIKKLQAEVDKGKDPIDRLRSMAALERAKAVDSSTFEEGFVAHARSWADSEGIGLGAFRSSGVPDDVLRRAGFEVSGGRRGGRRVAGGGGGRQRARSVTMGTIKDHVRRAGGTFVLSDVMRDAGGSPATVRKAVEELVEAGEVEKLGPVQGYSGRGRVPTQYSVSR